MIGSAFSIAAACTQQACSALTCFLHPKPYSHAETERCKAPQAACRIGIPEQGSDNCAMPNNEAQACKEQSADR